MADENCQQKWSPHQILHQTKNKYKQLAASLLLTSSLISHKQKISEMPKERAFSPGLKLCHGILKTSKMNLNEQKLFAERPQRALSNIQQLKFLARKLQQEQITKLGKQNRNADAGEEPKPLNVCQTEVFLNNNRTKKNHKRKIIKGRPEMYALIKRRKFLNFITEQSQPLEPVSSDANVQQTINNLLNKNNLLKFIVTKNEQNCQTNIYDNFLKQKQQHLPETSTRLPFRRSSAASFKHIEKTNYLSKYCNREEQHLKAKFPERLLSLGHKRYSVSHTIQ